MKRNHLRHLPNVLAVALILVGAVAAGSTQKVRKLTLRVNNATGARGEVVAIVLRTYASRPLGQGQICFTAGRRFPNSRRLSARLATTRSASVETGPFASLESYKVFAKNGDVQADARLETAAGGHQQLVLQFSSDTASVNRSDGPLAVLYLRLRNDVRAKQTYELQLDAAQTLLFGTNGKEFVVRPKSGQLRIRGRGTKPRVEVDGDMVRPGDRVAVGVETFEPFAIAEGRVALHYDPAIISRPPVVKMDRRYGKRRFSVDNSTPGFLEVMFESRRARTNRVPGKFIEIRLRTSRNIPSGTESLISFDRGLTFFLDADGDKLPVKLRNKTLTFSDDARESDGDSDSEDSVAEDDEDDGDSDSASSVGDVDDGDDGDSDDSDGNADDDNGNGDDDDDDGADDDDDGADDDDDGADDDDDGADDDDDDDGDDDNSGSGSGS